MISVSGNIKKDIDRKNFGSMVDKFEKAFLDIGTGDGRFVYKNAQKDKTVLYVGMDPAEKQLKTYSAKANRKKLANCLFIVGSIENIPSELFSSFDEIYINLPWGSLLEKIVKTDIHSVNNIAKLLKKNGKVTIVLGYAQEFEPSETKRLLLPKIDNKYIEENIVPSFEKDFNIKVFRKIDKNDLDRIETTWAKKLKFGRNRDIYLLEMERIN